MDKIQTMSKIAIIPARGGSKRIPRKNIKEFLGKPIISYAIQVATESKLFDKIMVSTDDEEIAEISKQYGADVPFFRSKENSDDFSSTVDVIKEVLLKYDRKFEYGCCIYPCTPLLTVEKLKSSDKLIIEKNKDTVFPIVKYSYPPQRGFAIQDDNVVMINPLTFGTRTQDLEPIYHDAGMFYWFKSEAVFEQNTLFCKNSEGIILSETETQDIDNLTDWKLAEMKYKLLYGE
jgi:N-acylneuraminate cytidylyltransferase